MMKRIALAAAALTHFLVATCLAQTTGETQRYAVVKFVNYDKRETNIVMSATVLRNCTAELQTETQLFDRALAAAAKAWREDEALRKQSFPSSALGIRRATVIGPAYNSQEEATAALNKLRSGKVGVQPRRQPSKAESERDRLVAQGMDALAEEMDDLKAAMRPDTSVAPSTNKIALTAGQVVHRTTAGQTHTRYHVAVPDSFDPAKPPPLLVVISLGGDGLGMMNSVRASANKIGWMVIGCDGLRNGMKIEAANAIQQDLINDLHTLIPYDTARLYYGGFSGGAWQAYYMTWRFKERCAGIVAFGGWLGDEEARRKPFQKNMAIAMVNGDQDGNALAYEETDTARLRHRRCEVKTFHFSGGHSIAPTKVIDEAMAWLEEDWKKRGSRSVGR